MIVELLRNGNFEIEIENIKNAIYTDNKEGIILEFKKGGKITIKNNKENEEKWILNPEYKN